MKPPRSLSGLRGNPTNKVTTKISKHRIPCVRGLLFRFSEGYEFKGLEMQGQVPALIVEEPEPKRGIVRLEVSVFPDGECIVFNDGRIWFSETHTNPEGEWEDAPEGTKYLGMFHTEEPVKMDWAVFAREIRS